MIERCRNAKNKRFIDYGGRGIIVCERWTNFENFLSDVGPRQSALHSIDRYPNMNGNYEPGNVRWATPKEQQRNRRVNHLVTHNGETRCIAEWAESFGMRTENLASRLRMGWSFEEAVSRPIGRYRKENNQDK